MNRKAVRTFAAFAAALSPLQRVEAAKMAAEQVLGGPFDSEEPAM